MLLSRKDGDSGSARAAGSCFCDFSATKGLGGALPAALLAAAEDGAAANSAVSTLGDRASDVGVAAPPFAVLVAGVEVPPAFFLA